MQIDSDGDDEMQIRTDGEKDRRDDNQVCVSFSSIILTELIRQT